MSQVGSCPARDEHKDTPRPVQAGVTDALHWDRDNEGFLAPGENERYRSPSDLLTPLDGGYRVSYAGGINTSVFNPGGGRIESTRRNLDFDEDPAFEDSEPLGIYGKEERRRTMYVIQRRTDAEELDHTCRALNHHTNLLRQANMQQFAENELDMVKFQNECVDRSEKLEFQTHAYGEAMERLELQKKQLEEAKFEMVRENEHVFKQIKETNAKLVDDRNTLIRHVAELEASRQSLDSRIAAARSELSAGTGRADESRIASMTPGGTRSAEVGTPATPQYVNADGSEVSGKPPVGATSTPAQLASKPILKRQSVQFYPFVNNKADGHVTGSVYRSEGVIASGGGGMSSTDGISQSRLKDVHEANGHLEGGASNSGGAYDFDTDPDFDRAPGPYPRQGQGSQNRCQDARFADDYADRVRYGGGPTAGGSRLDQTMGGQSRRENVSAFTTIGFDERPSRAEVGGDNSVVGAEIVQWSADQSTRIRYNPDQQSARRPSISTEAFTGKRPWRDWYSDFVEDRVCANWTKQECLSELLRCLRVGPGRIAVTRWRSHGNGTYDDLVSIASNLLGCLVLEDPMALFRKRIQGKGENHRMFGLELQDLYCRARPGSNMYDPYVQQELFKQFITGLREQGAQRVASEAWKGGTTLQDMFMAIENQNMKQSVLAGIVPVGAAAIVDVDPELDEVSDYEVIEFEDEDGYINAVRFEGGKGRRVYPKKDQPGTYGKDQGGSYRKDQGRTGFKPVEGKSGPTRVWRERPKTWTPKETAVPDNAIAVIPPKVASDKESATKLDGIPPELVKDLTNMILKSLGGQKSDRPRLDRRALVCYRCQEAGHFASECQAPKPVYRRVNTVEEYEEVEQGN